MTQTSRGKQQSAFSRWLRTGRLPSVEASDGVELKYNPWHDPEDGRFTFAGAGRYYGAGGGKTGKPRASDPGSRQSREAADRDTTKSGNGAHAAADALWRKAAEWRGDRCGGKASCITA